MITRWPLASFFALAYAFSWIAWAPLLERAGLIEGPSNLLNRDVSRERGGGRRSDHSRRIWVRTNWSSNRSSAAWGCSQRPA
jgi:hypothetical protein